MKIGKIWNFVEGVVQKCLDFCAISIIILLSIIPILVAPILCVYLFYEFWVNINLQSHFYNTF